MSGRRRDFIGSSPARPVAHAIADALPDIELAKAEALVRRGSVFVAGKRCTDPRVVVPDGCRVVVHLSEAVASGPSVSLSILYEDEDVVVVNKAPGQHVNETETSAAVSLVEQLADRQAFTVHRIDRETSGVVLLAKGRGMADQLSREFQARTVEKTYLAIVKGRLLDEVIDAPIGADRRRPRARAVVTGGKRAETRVRTLGELDDVSSIEARPVTGRTHQIRVHLAHRGAPIIGDALYGGVLAVRLNKQVVTVSRVMLHALELVIPIRGTAQAFRAPIPEDLLAFARLGLPLETASR